MKSEIKKSKEVYRALISISSPEDIKREYFDKYDLLTYIDRSILESYFKARYNIDLCEQTMAVRDYFYNIYNN